VDLGLAAGALFLLAIVAFRRARGVLSPTARRAAALVGIVWLTRELFR
jgi:hypothetical protein